VARKQPFRALVKGVSANLDVANLLAVPDGNTACSWWSSRHTAGARRVKFVERSESDVIAIPSQDLRVSTFPDWLPKRDHVPNGQIVGRT